MLFEINDHIHSRFTWSSTKRNIRVRFHLAKGEHYQKWQIRHDGEVKYFSPDDFSLRIENGVLKNSPTTAKKIYDGENKTVCAWINCRRVEAHSKSENLNMDVMDMSLAGSEQISYNPRVAPNWRNSDDENIDNQHIDLIISDGRGLYVPEDQTTSDMN